MKKKALLGFALSMALVLAPVTDSLSVKASTPGIEGSVSWDAAYWENVVDETGSNTESAGEAAEAESEMEEPGAQESEGAGEKESETEESGAEASEGVAGEEDETVESRSEVSEGAAGEDSETKEPGIEVSEGVSGEGSETEESSAEASEGAAGEESVTEEPGAEASEDASEEESETEGSSTETSEDAAVEEGITEEPGTEASEDGAKKEAGTAVAAEGAAPAAEAGSNAQITNDENGIPDAALFQIILQGDMNHDGILTVEEAKKISLIDVRGASVNDFTGLSKYLSNLEGIYADIEASDEALDSLYAEIVKLEKLSDIREIKVRSKDWDTLATMESIKDLNAITTVNDSLDFSAFSQLNILSVTGEFPSVTGLDKLINLRALSIAYGGADISADKRVKIIGNLPVSLESLTLSGCDLPDITETTIPQMKKLTNLLLRNNGLKSLKGLEGVGGEAPYPNTYRRVEISRNEIENLEGIEASDIILNAQSISLYENKLKSLAGIENLKNPRDLQLYHNQLTDVTALGSLTGLESLDVSDNQLTDVTALGSLTGLKSLNVTNNQLTDVTALGSLTGLESLRLGSNPLITLPDLTGFAKLAYLDLFRTDLSAEEIREKVPTKFSEDENWFAHALVPPFTVSFQKNLDSDDIRKLLVKGATQITMEKGCQIEVDSELLKNLTDNDDLAIHYSGEPAVQYRLTKTLITSDVKDKVVLKGSPIDTDISDEEKAAVEALFAEYEELPSLYYFTNPGIGMSFQMPAEKVGSYKLYYYDRKQKSAEEFAGRLWAREVQGGTFSLSFCSYSTDMEAGKYVYTINKGMQHPASEGFYFIVDDQYSISQVKPAPSAVKFNVVGVIGGRNVTFTSETEDAVIYYSSKGSTLTTQDASVKNGGTVLFENFYGTLYARAYKDGVWSNVSRLVLKIPVVKTPTITNKDGKVTITTATPNSTIYYTTDGTTPSPSNGRRLTKSTGTFSVASNCTVKAIAVRSCFTNSEVASAKVTAPKIGAPSFQVKGVIGGREVTFNSTDPKAEIYYSYTTSSITTKDKHVKAGQKVLFQNYYGTVYARAYVNGRWSNVSRLVLKIPVVNKPTITSAGNGKVKIATSTPKCTIYYTTDGSTPSPSNGKRISASSSVITVGSGKTVKAIAVRSCFTNSDVVIWKQK